MKRALQATKDFVAACCDRDCLQASCGETERAALRPVDRALAGEIFSLRDELDEILSHENTGVQGRLEELDQKFGAIQREQRRMQDIRKQLRRMVAETKAHLHTLDKEARGVIDADPEPEIPTL